MVTMIMMIISDLFAGVVGATGVFSNELWGKGETSQMACLGRARLEHS